MPDPATVWTLNGTEIRAEFRIAKDSYGSYRAGELADRAKKAHAKLARKRKIESFIRVIDHCKRAAGRTAHANMTRRF